MQSSLIEMLLKFNLLIGNQQLVAFLVRELRENLT